MPNGLFFRPKRRKQAFIGSRNKRPSSAVLLPDAVARWRGRRALPQFPFGRHEVNIAEKRLDKSVYLSRNGVVLCCIGAVPSYQVSLHCGLTLPHVMLACGCTGLPRNFERSGHCDEGSMFIDRRWASQIGKWLIRRFFFACRVAQFSLGSCWPRVDLSLRQMWSCLRHSADWMGAPRPTIQMP